MNKLFAGTRRPSTPQGFAFKDQQAISRSSNPSVIREGSGFSALKTIKQLFVASQAQQLTPFSTSTSSSAIPPEDFETRIRREFIEGSAISVVFLKGPIEFVRDYDDLAGGEFSSPLYEAFGWNYRRFGWQALQSYQAVLLRNEDGSCWQGKLDRPRTDKNGKVIKYETPVGNGSRAFLPSIPPGIRQLIARRYNVNIPEDGSFWDWYAAHPELNIPLILTEGGKKALSLLSQGYVAIALYGVDGGARTKDSEGNRCKLYLIPDLLPFVTKGRQIIFAFDQDAEAKTRERVDRALIRLASLLERTGCCVSIAFWEGRLGKGVDDLIVYQGEQTWNEVYQAALPFKEWSARRKLLKRLTYAPSAIVNTPDLSRISWNQLPREGLLAIYSAKGTGKTKMIAQLAQAEQKTLVATHRICLGRNLSDRLGVHWRGDLDKANGHFIFGGAYTLRIGFCVDSLLAIDPSKFAGCVLIIDEVVQVLRHLLTSTTCRKDGRLPILLSRFQKLIQQARLVVIADADLNNTTLEYLKTLRGDTQSVYLIENQFQSNGYDCNFIKAPNATGTIARLLQAVSEKQRIFVSTDSKNQSKQLAYQCYRLGLNEADVLILNSETSGGEREQAFIKNPDRFLAENSQIRVVIASPSLCTGVSVESQFFDQVFGLFWGVSLTDADMAQGLLRVRDSIPRTIWCAKTGRNFCPFSRSTFSGDIIQALKTRTDLTTMLLHSWLRRDLYEALTSIDWNHDPHIKLFAQITADTNCSMWNLRAALLARLQHEGHQITIVDLESDPIIQAAMKAARDQIRQLEAEAIAAAPRLTIDEQLKLESQDYLTSEQQLSLMKTALADFYCVDEVSSDLVLEDKAGLHRSRLLALEHQLYPETAQQRDIQALEQQMQWYKGICSWDIVSANLKREARSQLGLEWYLEANRTWTKYDNEGLAQRARNCAGQVKTILGLGNLGKISDTQIVHQLLSQLGLKVIFNWSKKVAGHEGEKLQVYRLDVQVWNQNLAVLHRRAVRRQAVRSSSIGSPPTLNNEIRQGGDPAEPGDSAGLIASQKYDPSFSFNRGNPQPSLEAHSQNKAENDRGYWQKCGEPGG